MIVPEISFHKTFVERLLLFKQLRYLFYKPNNNKMVLKYYFDLMSQPSRAMYILLKLSKIPVELCPVALRKGEHFTEEFKKNLSKFQKVPFIHDGNFHLSESVAITRYLSNKYGVPEKWYSKNIEQQARIDEYLEWQHHNIRAHCAMYFRKKWLEPILSGQPISKQVEEKYESNMIQSLDLFEELFLQNQNYVAGDLISIADIFAACEIEQPRICGFDCTQNRPVLKAWMERVRSECSPFYAEAHQLLNKMAESAGKNVKPKL